MVIITFFIYFKRTIYTVAQKIFWLKLFVAVKMNNINILKQRMVCFQTKNGVFIRETYNVPNRSSLTNTQKVT